MENKFTVDYFISKFEAIPEDKWCVLQLDGPRGTHCAIGHCLYNDLFLTKEAVALIEILRLDNISKVAFINDGSDPRYQQPTPKQRVLAALYDIKSNQAVKEAEEIINEKQLHGIL